ncbi:CLUMA_CG002874, isoform A [Clunio marinus]|uniref:CLUMA_CG002874, isoform A n=1 Tax=Clunio marinus TaxID=568069 RepID=A0A1J1HQJ0_9DIPT|nr:CLUMA_CG002874, isoform A [Clunio marinus]
MRNIYLELDRNYYLDYCLSHQLHKTQQKTSFPVSKLPTIFHVGIGNQCFSGKSREKIHRIS